MVDFREKLDNMVSPVKAKHEQVEITHGVRASMRNVSWFVSKMFNPEDNVWVWIRRIANILVFPLVVMVGIIMLQVLQNAG